MRRLMILFLALALFSAACGGGDDGGTDVQSGDGDQDAPDDTPDDAPDDTPDDAPDDDTTSSEPPAEFNISEVEQSIVQIQGQGTFVEPDVGALSYGLTGTGFLISADGLVVTNNHVVQGAATLSVSFSTGDGEINAQILGVSECSDLAVIQLVGDGYTPLTFREDPVTAGLDVFSAGFPAGDTADFNQLDYTLTRGIVSSITADGESNWASVDGVLEHDAKIRGGSSGGPLVDDNGQIVGVNYAGHDDFDTHFAISAADARPIIERLVAGEDVDSLGINGNATVFDGGLTGIFISSIESGSPADQAGMEAGDILFSLEGLFLADDGTMEDYCDVIRTKGSDATMDFEIYRPSLDLVLDGQINGEPIVIPLITQTVIEGGGATDSDGATTAPQSTYTYTSVTDDQGLIVVSIPESWSDVNGEPNPNFGPSIWASPDLQGWLDTWGVPGIIVESSPTLTSADIPAQLEARSQAGVCDDFGAEAYDDGFYAGTLQIWGNCGGTDTLYVVLMASPLDPDQDFLVRVEVQAVEPRDVVAADEALATFIADI